MLKKIILVFKTHFDFGFTDLASKVLEQYSGTMLEDVEAACRGTRDLDALRFVFTLPAWPLLQMTRHSERKEVLQELIEERSVVWHALPFTIHADFAAVEDVLYSLRFAGELAQRTGQPMPKAAKMTDVPGHGRILPTLLRGAGIEFLHLGCNEYAMPPAVPPLFFWEGPDGARVLTMYCPDGYGCGDIVPENWELPVWMAMLHTHDNAGPQSPEVMRDIVAEARAAWPDVEIRAGSLDDFYEALAECDLSGVPVIKGDLADSWIHGVGSYPREVGQVRRARRDVGLAEKHLALTRQPAPGVMDEAREALVLFDEHTWGLDVKTWMAHDRAYDKAGFLAARGSAEYAYMEASWEEQRVRARDAADGARAAVESAQRGDAVTVFNPGGAPFSGWAEAARPVKGQLEVFGVPHVYVEEVPPLHCVAYEATAPVRPLCCEADGAGMVVENHRYRLRFDAEKGVITALEDKALGIPLLQARGGDGVFGYRYDIYSREDVEGFLEDYHYIDSEWGRRDNGRIGYPEGERRGFDPAYCGYELNGHTLTLWYEGLACAEYGDAEQIALKVTLPPAGDEVFVELALAGKQASPVIESGSLLMPLPGVPAWYRFNKNGDVIDPRVDIVDGANHALYCIEAFAAAGGEAGGVCVVAHDTPLLAIGETGIYTCHERYVENEPVLVFDLFNNMWGTNFPQWTEGDMRFCFTLFGTRDPAPMGRALALQEGALVDTLAPAECPVALPEAVAVSLYAPREDGALLRLRDTGGVARTLHLAAKEPGVTLQRADHMGRPLEDAAGEALETELGRYGLCSVIVHWN